MNTDRMTMNMPQGYLVYDVMAVYTGLDRFGLYTELLTKSTNS